jgi:hypothetical protein
MAVAKKGKGSKKRVTAKRTSKVAGRGKTAGPGTKGRKTMRKTP